MRIILVVLWTLSPVFLFVCTGCEPQPVVTEPKRPLISDCNELATYARYAPVKISILPLTEFVSAGEPVEGAQIKAYASLADSFGCQVKSPGVFRFELYKAVPRSAEPKGSRITIWHVDLADPAENNNYWRDFLRAYEFDLYLESAAAENYILQVTCLCPNGKRLSAEFYLRHAQSP